MVFRASHEASKATQSGKKSGHMLPELIGQMPRRNEIESIFFRLCCFGSLQLDFSRNAKGISDDGLVRMWNEKKMLQMCFVLKGERRLPARQKHLTRDDNSFRLVTVHQAQLKRISPPSQPASNASNATARPHNYLEAPLITVYPLSYSSVYEQSLALYGPPSTVPLRKNVDREKSQISVH